LGEGKLYALATLAGLVGGTLLYGLAPAPREP